ncbi:Phosphoglycerate kinase family protein [Leishmania donovani]|uniref:phosphoglycerate kinase n=1 Tax=Leishmania donovani TaxID=5661 RepID=A0A504XFK0_LEIDO|nr:Phosphoglycerate kinase family protein [Leishmania donovani]
MAPLGDLLKEKSLVTVGASFGAAAMQLLQPRRAKLLLWVPGLHFAPSTLGVPGCHQASNTIKTSLSGTPANEQRAVVFCAAHLHRKFGPIIGLEDFLSDRNKTSTNFSEHIAAAEVLASETDIFADDSLGTSHRAIAIRVELPRLPLRRAAGDLIERGLAFYSKLLREPAPAAGASRSSCTAIFVSGVVALTFLVARGYQALKEYEPDERKNDVSTSFMGRDCSASSQSCSQYAAELLRILPVDGGSTPSRHLWAGAPTVGVYELITWAPSVVTVPAALPETVTYQVFQHLSEPLHRIVSTNAPLCTIPQNKAVCRESNKLCGATG